MFGEKVPTLSLYAIAKTGNLQEKLFSPENKEVHGFPFTENKNNNHNLTQKSESHSDSTIRKCSVILNTTFSCRISPQKMRNSALMTSV